MQGLDKCPEGWGSSRLCEGQNQSLSCAGNRDKLASVTVFLAPTSSSAGGKTLAGLEQGRGQKVQIRDVD